MKARLLGVLSAAALFGSVSYGQAQVSTTIIELSPEQRTTIYRDITRERIRTGPPVEFRASMGIEVPASVELYEMPATVEVPTVRRYRYTVVDDEVILVDPGTRRVVQILRR